MDVIALADRVKYDASATEQEILHGVFAAPDAAEHVFAYCRAIEGIERLADVTGAADFLDVDEQGRLDEAAHQRLEHLKGELRARLGAGHVFDYRAHWALGNRAGDRADDDGRVTTEHLDRLCADVYTHLARVIEAEIATLEQVAPLTQERDAQRRFGEERARGFIGRAEALARLAAYTRGVVADGESLAESHGEAVSASTPLVVVGASGAGKSALLGRAVAQARAAQPTTIIVERYIGATPGSSDLRALLSSVCRELALAYGTDENAVPSDEQELARDFAERLSQASAERPLLLFLDALDQLGRDGQPAALYWIPTNLPPHMRLVASVAADPPELGAALLRARLGEAAMLELTSMPPEEGGALLDTWLTEGGRTLQPAQRERALAAFAVEGLPLYLKLAFEETRHWRSFAPLEDLPPTIPAMIQRLFDRLSAPDQHGPLLVERSLAYLGAAKQGLSEDELLDALSADADMLAEFRRRSPKSPPAERLPPVIWSRLYFDLEPYLTERSADGAILLAFYHRQLAEAVAAVYLTEGDGRRQARHRALAHYFGAQPLALGSNQTDVSGGSSAPERAWPANLRKLDELPYQQTMGAMWEEVFQTLTDLSFLEEKVARLGVVERTDGEGVITKTYTGVYLLQDDYALALKRMPAEH